MRAAKLKESGGFMALGNSEAARYRAEIAKVMSGESSDVVFNGTLEHACIVIEEAFEAARSHVRILTNRLDCNCYDRDTIVDSMRRFLDRPGMRLDVLVEDETSAATAMGRRFIEEAESAAGERFTILAVPQRIVEQYKYNFLLVDDVALRFEEDRRAPVAVVSGGNEALPVVKNLLRVFNAIQSASRPLAKRVAQAA
ncbi:hypothetical protein B7G68_15150 [Caulobacter segnis]|uniref:DUF7931 domain-containing protein n=2 Tax=Caulobacter segnis TaxID=88688 RepID=D5VLM7_CAUST|nr:hypothetical protein [Caulobacter segnis]ADG11400.1 hypothetical protein Cseg_2956 [Caulobacter segnis ATCC 21756]AVQ03068.1 hypothetical protein B7G68_15150 [Caulobacter segnis]